MSYFDDINNEISRGMEGKNDSVSMGHDRMNKYIGIRKRTYTLIFGSTGSGKSAFLHDAYILNPFDWYMRNKHTTKMRLKVFLFSMERSKVYTLSKWLSRQIFVNQGISIPIPKMLGWWEQKMTKDEHDLVLMYQDYMGELEEVVEIIEGAQNPTGIFKPVKAYADKHGKTEKISDYKSVYLPDNEDELVLIMPDHMGLVTSEKGMNKKESIDKTSQYLQGFRDLNGYIPIAVSQINRDLSNPIYQKMDAFEPNLDQVKESGRPAEDADVVISLFQPSRYKTSDPQYTVSSFIDPLTGGDYFRKIKILKNTYGEADIGFGMAFMGSTGKFKELPRKKDMEGFNYSSLFDNTYFL